MVVYLSKIDDRWLDGPCLKETRTGDSVTDSIFSFKNPLGESVAQVVEWVLYQEEGQWNKSWHL